MDLALYKTVAEKAETKPLVQAFLSDQIDGVTFSSSSTVDFFRALFTKAQWRSISPKVRAFCLGPITRRSLNATKLTVVAEAKMATLDALVECLLKAHGKK